MLSQNSFQVAAAVLLAGAVEGVRVQLKMDKSYYQTPPEQMQQQNVGQPYQAYQQQMQHQQNYNLVNQGFQQYVQQDPQVFSQPQYTQEQYVQHEQHSHGQQPYFAQHQNTGQQQDTNAFFVQLPPDMQQKVNNDVASFKFEKAKLLKGKKLQDRRNFMTNTEFGVDIKYQIVDLIQKKRKEKRAMFIARRRGLIPTQREIKEELAIDDDEMEHEIKEELENLTQAYRDSRVHKAWKDLNQQERIQEVIDQDRGRFGIAYYSDFN
jgi:hypothetical protein